MPSGLPTPRRLAPRFDRGTQNRGTQNHGTQRNQEPNPKAAGPGAEHEFGDEFIEVEYTVEEYTHGSYTDGEYRDAQYSGEGNMEEHPFPDYPAAEYGRDYASAHEGDSRPPYRVGGMRADETSLVPTGPTRWAQDSSTEPPRTRPTEHPTEQWRERRRWAEDGESTDGRSTESGAEAEQEPGVWRVVVGESLQVILPAVILALIVHLFLAQATVVYGQSMEPNLHEHERLIIDKISYRVRPPQRNDIVVLDLPHMDELLVKRIIGLPGEVLEIRHGQVYINGEPALEPFPHDLGFQGASPVTLGPLTYYVLGDNRENSNDSRAFGPVFRDNILGRVWLRYWPFNQFTLF